MKKYFTISMVLSLMLLVNTVLAQVTAPYVENFDNNGTIPTNWAQGASNSEPWRFNNGSGAGHQGNVNNLGDHTVGVDGGSGYYAWVDDSTPDNLGTTLESPTIDASSLIAPEMRLWINSDNEGNTNVSFSIDFFDGAAWNTGVFTHSGNTSGWQEVIVSLSSFTITGPVQFRFIVDENNPSGQFYDDFAIDDFSLANVPTCPQPSNLTVGTITSTTADLTWTTGGATDWLVEYGPFGFTPGTGTTVVVNTTPSVTLSSLSAATSYDVYVMDSCGIADISLPISTNVFTNCAIVTAPFVENFDDPTWVASGGSSGNQINQCWTSTPTVASTLDHKWTPRNNGPGSGNGPLNDVTGGNFMYCEESASTAGQIADLVSPVIDVSGLTTPALYFNQHRNMLVGDNIPDMDVDVTNDGGTTWTTVYSITDRIQNAPGDPWSYEFVNLAAYTGDTIQVRFRQISNGCCGDAAIDSIVVDEAPTCPWPTGVSLVNISDTSAVIGWSDPSGTTWDIEWGPVGFTQGTGAILTTSNNPDTIYGLAGNIDYDVYVRANCTSGGNGTSIWIGPLTFKTECSAFTAPYTENWDTYSNVTDVSNIDCWSFYRTGTNGFAQTRDAGVGTTPVSGTMQIELGNGNNTAGDTIALISPRLEDLDDGTKQIRFWAAREATPATLAVGMLTNPRDPSTYTPLQNITNLSSGTYQYYVITLDIASVNGEYIVFVNTSGSTFSEIYIDDFVFEDIPACSPSHSGIASGTTDNSATTTWTPGTGVSWDIEWGVTGFTQGTNPGGITNTTNNPHTITGLTPNTGYEFYIRDNCSDGSTSTWSGPYQFNTQCTPVNAPFIENFDGTTWFASGNDAGNGLDLCWSSAPNTNDPNNDPEPFKWIPRNNGPGSGNGPLNDHTTGTGNFLYTEASGSTTGDVAMLTTPLVYVNNIPNPALTFWYHRFGTPIPDLVIQVTRNGGQTWNTVNTLTGQAQTSSSAPWLEEIISLAAYANDTIQVRFIANGQGCCADQAIDDVSIATGPSCFAPTNLSGGATASDSAEIFWTGGGANDWNIEWGPVGFTPGTGPVAGGGTRVTAGNDTIEIGDLVPVSGIVEFYVRDSCGPGDVSPWTGPYQINLACVDLQGDNINTAIEVPLLPYIDARNSSQCYTSVVGNGSNDIFYRVITDTCTQSITASLCGGGTSYDSFLRIFDKNGTSLATNDDFCGLQSEITFNVTSADTFFVIVEGFGTNNGPYSLSITETLRPACISCPAPTAPGGSAVAVDSVEIFWTTGGASDWNVDWGPVGFTPSGSSSNLINATNDTIGIGSLTPAGGIIQFYVRDSCVAGSVSSWVGPFQVNLGCVNLQGDNFSTAIPVSTAIFPYTDSKNTSQCYTSVVGNASNDVFYEVYADSCTQSITATLCGGGTTYDSFLRVFGKDGTTSIVTNDDFCGLQSQVTFNVTAADTFYVVVEGFGSNNGPYTLDLTRTINPICISCPSPTSLASLSATTNSIDVYWTTGGATDWQIHLDTCGGILGDGTIINATNDTTTLSGLATGQCYQIYVRDSCGPGDVSIWTGPITVSTLCNVTSAPFIENFDGASWFASGGDAGNTIDVCWSANPAPSQGSIPFKWIPRNTGPTSGNGPLNDHTTGTGNFVYTEASGSGTGDIAFLVTPAIDLSTLTAPEMRFWYHRFSTTQPDLDVEITNDGGATWTPVFNLTGQTQASAAAPWLEAIVNIASYANDTIQVRFKATGFGCCADQAIDDLSIIEAPSCIAPSALGGTAITSSSAEFYWTPGNASDWNIEWGLPGFALGSGSPVNSTNDSIVVSGLPVGGMVEFYVRDSCGVGDVSAWVGPIQINLGCVGLSGDVISDPIVIPSLPYNDVSTTADPCYTNTIGNTSSDVFYEITTGQCTQSITATLCGGATTYDSFLRVLSSTGALLTSNDDFCGVQSEVTQTVTPNTTYYIVVEGFGANNGPYGLDVTETSIVGCSPCPSPSNLDTANVGFTSADLLWTTGGATDWVIDWGPQGFTPGTGAGSNGTRFSTSTNPHTLSGLLAGTCYDYYVQDSCAGLGLSSQIGPFTFCTPCAVPVASFTNSTPVNGSGLINFDGSGSTNADSLYWDFGDGSSDNGATPSHTYATNGSYTVSLTVCASCNTGDSCVTITQNVNILGIGIEESVLGRSLELYPNPTSDVFGLKFTSPYGQDMTIRVVNTLGQTIYTEDLTNFAGKYSKSISIGDQPKGIYFLQIITEDGVINRRVALQ